MLSETRHCTLALVPLVGSSWVQALSFLIHKPAVFQSSPCSMFFSLFSCSQCVLLSRSCFITNYCHGHVPGTPSYSMQMCCLAMVPIHGHRHGHWRTGREMGQVQPPVDGKLHKMPLGPRSAWRWGCWRVLTCLEVFCCVDVSTAASFQGETRFMEGTSLRRTGQVWVWLKGRVKDKTFWHISCHLMGAMQFCFVRLWEKYLLCAVIFLKGCK